VAEGKKLPISVVISAVDNVTYKVMGINEKIKRVTAPVGKVQAAFKTLGDEAGLGKLAKGLGKVGSTGKEFFGELFSSVAKLGALGAAAGGAIYGIASSFGNAGDDIAMMSRRLGLSTDQFQEWSYAAKKANIDQETFNSSMGKLSKGAAEAAAGQGEALVAFNALGISVRDQSGHLKGLDKLLPAVADKLGMVKNQNLRNALAAKLFGREGMKLNDLFNDGASGLAAMAAEAHKVGAVMSPDDIKLASQFDDGMKEISSTLLMVRNIIGAELAPVVLDLGKKLQTYILANKDKIREWAKAFADKLPDALAKIGSLLEGVASALQPVIRFGAWLVDTFGGTAVAVGALLVYFAPLISAFFSFIGALAGLVPLLTTVWTIFTTIVGVVQVLGALFVGLVGLPVAIGAALVAAAILIWKYWEPIKEFFSSIGDKISGLFGGNNKFTGTLSTQAPPQLGAELGFGKTVDAAARSSSVKNQNEVMVMFQNLPEGARVEKTKDEGNLDLSMGYGLTGGLL
jgi:hypothetical protein